MILLFSHRAARAALLMTVLPLVCALLPMPAGAADLPKPAETAMAQFDKEIAGQINRASAKVQVVFESEIKRQTQAGNLDGALATKQALSYFERRTAELSAPASTSASPVGQWSRPDGRVYLIEQGGRGFIVRGTEGTEAIEWEPAGSKFRITIPAIPNLTNYIWPEKDNTWSYSYEDPDKTIGKITRIQ
jgi:hypothetical protein